MVDANLHRFVDRKRIRAAIASAETSTNAAIAVSISAHVEGDIHTAALNELHTRARSRKRGRTAVLFFVVPSRRTFAVVGDASAHKRLGQETWDAIVALVQERFRAGDPTAGLVAGIEEIGRRLAHHFPRDGGTEDSDRIRGG